MLASCGDDAASPSTTAEQTTSSTSSQATTTTTLSPSSTTSVATTTVGAPTSFLEVDGVVYDLTSACVDTELNEIVLTHTAGTAVFTVIAFDQVDVVIEFADGSPSYLGFEIGVDQEGTTLSGDGEVFLTAPGRGDEPFDLSFNIPESGICDVEAARFDVQDNVAFMVGPIGASTPEKVRTLIADHPEVTVIVMEDVEGSTDDHANLAAARLVRAAGLGTEVPHGGVIASGGVDFFLAGVDRVVQSGAQLGVHSWATRGPTGAILQGADVPPDDPAHDVYLSYYAEMGIPEGFYWFTLDAAPANGIHWMTADEIGEWGIETG